MKRGVRTNPPNPPGYGTVPSDITYRPVLEDNLAVDIAPTVAQPRSLSTSREDNHAVVIAPTVGPSRSLANYGEDNHAVDISPTVAQPRAYSSSAGSIGTSLTEKASTSFSTPETCRRYPKVGPRSTSTKGRKRGRAMVATSTPEMAIIKKQHMVKMNVKQGSSKAVTDRTAKAKATAKTHSQ